MLNEINAASKRFTEIYDELRDYTQPMIGAFCLTILDQWCADHNMSDYEVDEFYHSLFVNARDVRGSLGPMPQTKREEK